MDLCNLHQERREKRISRNPQLHPAIDGTNHSFGSEASVTEQKPVPSLAQPGPPAPPSPGIISEPNPVAAVLASGVIETAPPPAPPDASIEPVIPVPVQSTPVVEPAPQPIDPLTGAPGA